MFVQKDSLTVVILSHISAYILLISFSNASSVMQGFQGMDILLHIYAHTLVEDVMTVRFQGKRFLEVVINMKQYTVVTNTSTVRFVGRDSL
jgi:hypothetical protein